MTIPKYLAEFRKIREPLPQQVITDGHYHASYKDILDGIALRASEERLSVADTGRLQETMCFIRP